MKRTLLLAYIVCFVTLGTSFSQCLNGTYTIGGIAPNYTTIASAVTALTTNGVCGPVIFNIRAGTYNEQITIPAISGTSVINNITFQSELLDSNSVLLTKSTTTQFILKLNGCNNIKFNKITIQSTFTSSWGVVDIATNSNNIAFSNCVLKGPVLSSLVGPHLIRALNINNNNNVFNNNLFFGGYTGIYYTSSSSSVYIPETKINNNSFQNQYYAGINISKHIAPEISNNTIDCSLSQTNFSGILMTGCTDNFIVKKNKLSEGGINITNSASTSINNGLIVNNFISTSKGIGIQVGACTYLNVVNNSVISNNFNYFPLHISNNNSNVNIINNIFSNNAGGYAVYRLDGPVDCNYNDYYSTGNILFYYNNNNVSTLSQWQNVTGFDSNSINVNPHFFSSIDLHTIYSCLNNLAIVSTFVTEDIDGEPRSSTTPDIGADEFTPIVNDAELINFENLFPPCIGLAETVVRVGNSGLNPINNMTINWELNGITQPSFYWTGNLLSTNSTTINLGNYNYISGIPYHLKVWVSNPNSLPDGSALNDTISIDFRTGMSGTYTIGGASPDYMSFNTAVSDLIINGVCGPVTFNVRPGTYNEQVTIPAILGSSSLNKIIFQSETGVNTSVVINNTNAGNTSTIYLNNSDYIGFKNMTITSTNGATAGNVDLNNIISIFNGSDHSLFENNKIIGAAGYCISTGTYSTPSSSYNKFINNDISNGYGGINLKGLLSFSNSILNNVFTNHTTAIYANSQDSLVISSNVITQNTTSTSYNVDIMQFSNIIFTKNKISVMSSALRFLMNSGSAGIIANNFIHCSGTTNISGLYISNFSSIVKIYNNSINITNTHTSSSAVYFNSAPGSFKNNNVINVGGGIAIYCSSSVVLNGFSNYNNLFVSGSQFAILNTTYYANLGLWKTATGLEMNSISFNTSFVSSSNLHTLDYHLNNAGCSVSGILNDDIDGENRNVLTPDIGADEFTPIITDATLIGFDNLIATCPGVTPIKVKLLNSGGPTINSASIYWQVNGVNQSTNNWTGTLLNADTAIVLLGNYNLLVGVNYTIKAWVKNPNGAADPIPANDTIIKTNFRTALSGNYTIGGTSPTYNTFNTAVSDLISRGICGPVTFNVRNGVYNEQITIPFINGSSFLNTIVFQSETADSSAVALTFNSSGPSNNYTVNFNSSSYVSIKKISIKALNSLYGCVINFTGNNHNILLLNNVIDGMPTTSSTTENSIILSNNVHNKGVIIDNNLISNGSIGICLLGVSLAQKDSSLFISHNIIKDQSAFGILIKYQESPVVTSNTITSNSTGSWTGIYSYYCFNSQDISKNKIIGLAGSSLGICIIYCSASSTTNGIISNNMISTNSDALYVTNSNYQNLYFNSIRVNSILGKCLYLNSNTNINNINNIYANVGGGYSIWVNGIVNLSVSNHNNFSSSGTYLANFTGNDLTTLNAWQTLTFKDSISYNYNPSFTSTSDLHLYLDTAINNKGISLPVVFDDIDGESRNLSTPDIGADEFTFVTLDASLVSFLPFVNNCSGMQSVKVLFKNEGSTPLSTAVINWSINGLMQPAINWSGNLIIADTVSVLLGNYLFISGNTYDIEAWVSSPNGLLDPINNNDSISIQILTPLVGIYTIGGTSADYVTISDAVNDLNTYGVCGPVTFKIRTGIYYENITVLNFTGSSELNRVIFESETLDSLDVDWRSSDYFNTAPLVTLNGAAYVTFRNISFRNLSSTMTCIKLIDGASYNVIKNCQIISQISLCVMCVLFEDYNSQICISNTPSSSNSNNNNIIENNIFLNGSIGIYLYPNPPTYNFGNIIRNNLFSRPGSVSIYAEKQSGMKIIDNKFTPNIYGLIRTIYMSQVNDSLVISGNNINTSYGQGSIYLDINNFTYTKIFNNYIYFKNGELGSAAVSIATKANSITEFINNTLRVDSSYSGGLSVNNFGVFKSYNNNITLNNSSPAFGIQVQTGSNYLGNNNNFYNLSGTLISYITTYSTLAAYQSATGKDLLSLNKNPHFSNGISYEINSADLNNSGVPYIGIEKDIEGNVRNVTTPDIGCYEFTSGNIDAGITNINSSSLNCSGINPVVVSLTNYGTSNLTTATIGWTVDGIAQTPFIFNGNINQNDSITNLTLGTFSSTGQNIIKAFPLSVNGGIDVYSYNDTITNNHNSGSLCGVYTIGPSGGDFSNFTIVRNKLASDGICGPVIFKVMPGVYQEIVTFQNITGSSIYNTITFEPLFGDREYVTICADVGNTSGDHFIITLDSAKYFRFKNLSFKALNDPYTNGNNITMLDVTNFSKNIIIDSCVFNGLGSFFSSDAVNDVAVRFEDSDTLQFTNNLVYDTYNSLYASGYNTFRGKNIIIKNNSITNALNGITIEKFYNAFVSENYIQSFQHPIGIIGNLAAGINLCKGIVFDKNKLFGFDRGISVSNTNSLGLINSKITNNFIDGWNNIFYSKNIEIEFNNMQLNMFDTLYSSNPQATLHLFNDTNIVLLNNNLVNLRYGYQFRGALWLDPDYYNSTISNMQVLECDYNNYFCPNMPSVFSLSGAYPFTLLEWQNLYHLDSNSVNLNPQYVSSSDFHILNNSLAGLAKPITGINTDIDNDLRNTIPTIGADEASGLIYVQSIEDKTNQLNIYPNPSNSEFTIELTNTDSKIYQIIITDITGKLIFETFCRSKKYFFNEFKLLPGIYLVKIKGDKVYNKKIIIK
ncbi:MAG: T9SS type A sorting domain-containing protein [Bacteroidia bacterium]|nr:T9SS type A sorting domain-containing protein [Bacteroidia bacterium]